MSSVGEALRRERLRKELSVEQISRETKIPIKLLEAIEQDHFDQLPGGVFTKSFVRQYARFLDLDDQELAAEIEQAINPVEDLPAFIPPPSQPAFKVPRMVEWEGSGRSHSSVLPALALVVAVILICSVVYAWWQRGHSPAAPSTTAAAQKAPTPTPVSQVTPAVVKSSEPAAKTTVSTAPQPEPATQPEDKPAPSANPTDALQITLAADTDTWVQAWADGKCVVVGTLSPNTSRTVSADQLVRIRTGNAGGLQLTINGKSAGPIGPAGQVREIQVTREGVHILAPPPKPALEPAPASGPEPL